MRAYLYLQPAGPVWLRSCERYPGIVDGGAYSLEGIFVRLVVMAA